MNIADLFEFVDALREHRENINRWQSLARGSAVRLAGAWKYVREGLTHHAMVQELTSSFELGKAADALARLDALELHEDERADGKPLFEKRQRALADALVAACFPATVHPVEHASPKDAVHDNEIF